MFLTDVHREIGRFVAGQHDHTDGFTRKLLVYDGIQTALTLLVQGFQEELKRLQGLPGVDVLIQGGGGGGVGCAILRGG